MHTIQFRRSISVVLVFSLSCFLILLTFPSSLVNFDERDFQRFDFQKARFDSSRLIRIYDWVWTGEKWSEAMKNSHVCLSTQGSMDRIHWLMDVVGNWGGPISVGIFITSEEEWIGLNILVNFYRKCDLLFKDFVSIHVVIPTKVLDFRPEKYSHDQIEAFLKSTRHLQCNQMDKFTSAVVSTFKAGEKSKSLMEYYPQNHMRNIARKACGTDWVLSTDIDIIPRPHAAELLNEFHESEEAQNCEKCAFVIPTFEVDEHLSFPESKKALVSFWKEKLAQPFHFNVFMEAHNATDYWRWASTNLEEDSRIIISHDSVVKAMKYYEPFYISSDQIPPFEERFLGYGFTRNSQVKEALAEEWTFKVLTPIFGVHWGIQNIETLINPGNEKAIRRNQTMANRKVFDLFMEELEFRKKLKKKLKIIS